MTQQNTTLKLQLATALRQNALPGRLPSTVQGGPSTVSGQFDEVDTEYSGSGFNIQDYIRSPSYDPDNDEALTSAPTAESTQAQETNGAYGSISLDEESTPNEAVATRYDDVSSDEEATASSASVVEVHRSDEVVMFRNLWRKKVSKLTKMIVLSFW